MAAFIAIGALAGANRSRVRILTVVQVSGVEDPESAQQLAEMRYLATKLVLADRALEARWIDAVEHEAIVGMAYDRMAPQHPHGAPLR